MYRLLSFFAENNIPDQSHIVGLGGGVSLASRRRNEENARIQTHGSSDRIRNRIRCDSTHLSEVESSTFLHTPPYLLTKMYTRIALTNLIKVSEPRPISMTLGGVLTERRLRLRPWLVHTLAWPSEAYAHNQGRGGGVNQRRRHGRSPRGGGWWGRRAAHNNRPARAGRPACRNPCRRRV